MHAIILVLTGLLALTAATMESQQPLASFGKQVPRYKENYSCRKNGCLRGCQCVPRCVYSFGKERLIYPQKRGGTCSYSGCTRGYGCKDICQYTDSLTRKLTELYRNRPLHELTRKLSGTDCEVKN
ncbi:uncharacterized protein LOC111644113 [Copidosoma floridanum]|nr:uncharacterized protein LOC111644113 [Copidosoma floridanum]